MKTIWCVEDEQSILDIILYTLESCQFEARGFSDGEQLEAALEKQIPDLLLLDIMLPGDSGMKILKRLRSSENTRDLPVIMTTAKGMELDKIQALDAGADDYLVKPFGMMEMIARIKAVLRRSKGSDDQSSLIESGKILMDTEKRDVSVDGEAVNLTRKEYSLLKLLMTSNERVFTREDLLEKIWHVEEPIETRTVDVHIRALRTKLKEEGERIETVRGVGYRMREAT